MWKSKIDKEVRYSVIKNHEETISEYTADEDLEDVEEWCCGHCREDDNVMEFDTKGKAITFIYEHTDKKLKWHNEEGEEVDKKDRDKRLAKLVMIEDL